MRREVPRGENDSIHLQWIAAFQDELRTTSVRGDIQDLVVDRLNLDPARSGQGLGLLEQEILEIAIEHALG